jgi:hypothetical protein
MRNECMKRSARSLVAMVLSATGVVCCHDAGHDREQIAQIEREWVQSFEANDPSVSERILSADFIGTDIDGTRRTKAELIAQMKPGPSPFEWHHLDEEDLRVRFYGDVGVVNGSESWKLKSDGRTGRYVWTDVFVKQRGEWKIVAAQDVETRD